MDWAPAVAIGVAVVSGLISWARQSSSEARAQGAASALIEERFQTLKEGEKGMAGDLKAAASELRSVATQMAALTAEQTVINRLNTVTLQSLLTKVEGHDRMLAEHGASIGMIRERMK